MATLRSRLEALEAKGPAGAASYCLVMHGTGDCASARQEAIDKFTAEHGCAPVNFISLTFVSPDGGRGGCNCPEIRDKEFAVTGPGADAIMAEAIHGADGTSLPVVKEPVQ